jgi:cell wall-active antibiotic response 4TMS protein YvqF
MNGNLICAIQGPVMMLTLGILLAADQMGTWLSFGRTWPILLIVFGLFKLAQRAGAAQPNVQNPGTK